LEQLALRCRTAAGRCGLDVEGGRFRPHLTLARANGIRADGWVRAFETIEPQSWLVDRFSLIQSQALPGGAGYRTLAEYRLAA
ncbi:MAG: 2'-5' RNA ligase family protein, partial [Propionicimonas sp.]